MRETMRWTTFALCLAAVGCRVEARGPDSRTRLAAVFEGRARDIALFALRHYEKARELDSITVVTRQMLQPGAWLHLHSSAIAVASLRAPAATSLSVDTSPHRSP